MNIVGVFDFSRSVRTADHPRDWQRRGANETSDGQSASRCPLHPGHAVSTSNPFPLPEGRRTQAATTPQPISIGRVRRFVGASFVSFASVPARKLPHYAAPPLQIEPAALGFDLGPE